MCIIVSVFLSVFLPVWRNKSVHNIISQPADVYQYTTQRKSPGGRPIQIYSTAK